MIIDDNKYYRLITKETFDSKVLEVKTFNDIYRKYKIVNYKKDEKIIFAEIIFEDLIKNIDNIIKIYDAEKIISSCIGFDNRYDNLVYYRIDDLYFIEFTNDYLGNDNQNMVLIEQLKEKGLM